MNHHPSEEQLVLYYYGEAHHSPETASHLDACEACRSSYQTLQRVLNTVDSLPVPERMPDYETHVWRRLAPSLSPRRSWYFGLPSWRPLIATFALIALVVAAFIAGRGTQPSPRVTTADAAQLRERVLLVALGAHLERTKMMLVELANAQPEGGRFDISFEQEAASRLLDANRLYRQTAASNGNYSISALLDELERVLVEIAHSPPSVPEQQLEDLRQRIEERSLLFKVKVFSSQFETRESAPSNTL